jgi:hypothetical protein
MVDAKDSFHSEIPLTPEAPEDIVDEVTEYFQGGAGSRVAVK